MKPEEMWVYGNYCTVDWGDGSRADGMIVKDLDERNVSVKIGKATLTFQKSGVDVWRTALPSPEEESVIGSKFHHMKEESELEKGYKNTEWVTKEIFGIKVRMKVPKQEEVKEKSKYYTPSIEEFRVGFEYEVWEDQPLERGWKEDAFLGLYTGKTKGKYNWTFKRLNEFINCDNIRVKYLDREDIESFGFIQLTDDCFNKDLSEYRGKTNCELRILIRQTVLVYIIDSKDESLVLFTGKIKNKSELEVLLKQLGICE